MFHVQAWGVWLIAALLPFSLTKNPFYLVAALVVIGFDYARLRRRAVNADAWNALAQIAIGLALFSVVFNVLFVNIGATRLATLPSLRLDLGSAVFQIGGAVTLESLTYGIAQGLGLVGIILTLATFNLLADHYQLLRHAPRFFYQSAIALSIAMTFVPQMMLAQAEIREAQALRGHRFRAWRDLAPLFIALVAEGLERSVTLAESMSARGFGRADAARPSSTGSNALIAAGLFLLICGGLATSYFPGSLLGISFLILGSGILIFVLRRVSQSVHASRYKRLRWRRADVVLVGAGGLFSAILLGVWIVDRAALDFYPYPRFALPPFNFFIAAAMLLLALPGMMNAAQNGKRDD